MKRLLALTLLVTLLLSLCYCAASPSSAEGSEPSPAVVLPPADAETLPAETEALPVATEAPALEGSLFLKVSSITFSLVGESDEIYLGLIPREEVTWESENPEVVAVQNGVLTATGVGTTVIHASYADRKVSCTAGCLAQTQEELEQLDYETLSAPKRLPPEVNLEEPCTYFDNAAIVGDSITYFLWQEESKNNYLGDMTFITRQGVSINSLIRQFKNLYFQGKEMYIEDIAAKCEAERIYIMLGCLDFQVTAARTALMDNWNIMLDRIAEKAPDKEIVIISNIPGFTEEGEKVREGFNELVAENNVNLSQLAKDRGIGFLDLGYYIQDHLGGMPAIYAKDEFHMNAQGSLVWMKVLRFYAQYEMEGGSLS